MKRVGEQSIVSVRGWRKAVAVCSTALSCLAVGGCGEVTTTDGQYQVDVALPPAAPETYAKVDDPSIPQRSCVGKIFHSSGITIIHPLVSEMAGKEGLYPRNIQSKGPDAATGKLQLENGQPQDPGAHQWYDVASRSKIADKDIVAHCKSGTVVDIEAVKTTTLGEVPFLVDANYEPGPNAYDITPPTVFRFNHIYHIQLAADCIPGWVEPITVNGN